MDESPEDSVEFQHVGSHLVEAVVPQDLDGCQHAAVVESADCTTPHFLQEDDNAGDQLGPSLRERIGEKSCEKMCSLDIKQIEYPLRMLSQIK